MSVSEEPSPSHRKSSEPGERSLAGCVTSDIADLLSEPLAAGLYLVATPIGNLADMTLRALSVLSRADVIYCEDTRHSAKLLQHYAIAARTRPFHEHNEDREIERAISGPRERKTHRDDFGCRYAAAVRSRASSSFAPRRRPEFPSFRFPVRPLLWRR